MEEISSLEVSPSVFVELQPGPYSVQAAFRPENTDPSQDIPWGQSFGYTAQTSKDLVIQEMPNICDNTYDGFSGVAFYLAVGDTFQVGTQLYDFFGNAQTSISPAYTYGLYTTDFNNYCNGNLLTDVFQLTFNGGQIATMTPLGQV